MADHKSDTEAELVFTPRELSRNSSFAHSTVHFSFGDDDEFRVELNYRATPFSPKFNINALPYLPQKEQDELRALAEMTKSKGLRVDAPSFTPSLKLCNLYVIYLQNVVIRQDLIKKSGMQEHAFSEDYVQDDFCGQDFVSEEVQGDENSYYATEEEWMQWISLQPSEVDESLYFSHTFYNNGESYECVDALNTDGLGVNCETCYFDFNSPHSEVTPYNGLRSSLNPEAKAWKGKSSELNPKAKEWVRKGSELNPEAKEWRCGPPLSILPDSEGISKSKGSSKPLNRKAIPFFVPSSLLEKMDNQITEAKEAFMAELATYTAAYISYLSDLITGKNLF